MAEKPLDLEQFFFTRNEIAQQHNNRLEMQAMTRVREHMVAQAQEEAKAASATKKKTTKADDDKAK